MKFLTIPAMSVGVLRASQAMEKPSFHTKGIATGKPGEYWWNPQLSPGGPMVVLVSIPQLSRSLLEFISTPSLPNSSRMRSSREQQSSSQISR